ncbi:MAG: stage V sporulation protein D [Tissierellaceae bacterium]|nr:stage V sporulation protein D [Tissierellaceae bacterium]
MNTPRKSSKTRLKVAFSIAVLLVTALTIRLGYLQIYKGDELKKGALEQWTKSIDIKPKRGIIYDRKGKKLAVSENAFTVWAYPADIKKPEDTARIISEILDMDKETVYAKITKNQSTEKIKQWITKEEANELRKQNLSGIGIVDDNKRYYPNNNFASHILGFTNIDNVGLTGIEKVYDNYLTGVPGKWQKMTDAANRQLPYDGEKVYEPTDGTSLVLTIDETIQHFAEKAAQQALLDNKAKNVSIVIMEPKTGDILSLVNKPDFDLNNPREPLDESLKREWANLPVDQLQDKWYELWRNFAVNDVYEPGSTFKLVTAAAALEENTTSLGHHYFCNGFVRDIKGVVLKCARWYNPHGSQSLREAMNNSCNVAFVNIGRQLGKERFYDYIKAFGFGQKTDIDLLGEQRGIIPSSSEVIKEVNLATMSYGHGIAITPIQLTNAVSAISNGGYLMKPRLVKEMIDYEGNVVTSFEPEIKRQVVSKETSDTMLSLMETVVSDGSGSRAKVSGYRVGGKTGTAQKIIDGRYAQGKYIASFIGVAPIDDPKVVILVIVDEPGGTYYGGSVAAPVAKNILEEIFNYLEIPPQFDDKDLEQNIQNVVVPDLRNLIIGEAGKTLTDLGLRYTTEYLELSNDSTVIEQFPAPGVEVQKGSIVDLYLNSRPSNNVIMPYLIDMSKDQVIKTLNEMNLKYTLNGEGTAVEQVPLPGEEITTNTEVFVEFK